MRFINDIRHDFNANDLHSIGSKQIEGKTSDNRSIQENSRPIFNLSKIVQIGKSFIENFQPFKRTISLSNLSTSIGSLLSLLKKSIQPIKTTNTKQTSQDSIAETAKALPSPESIKNHTDDNIGKQEVLDKNVAEGARFFQKTFDVQDGERAVLLAKISVCLRSDPKKLVNYLIVMAMKSLKKFCSFMINIHNLAMMN